MQFHWNFHSHCSGYCSLSARLNGAARDAHHLPCPRWEFPPVQFKSTDYLLNSSRRPLFSSRWRLSTYRSTVVKVINQITPPWWEDHTNWTSQRHFTNPSSIPVNSIFIFVEIIDLKEIKLFSCCFCGGGRPFAVQFNVLVHRLDNFTPSGVSGLRSLNYVCFLPIIFCYIVKQITKFSSSFSSTAWNENRIQRGIERLLNKLMKRIESQLQMEFEMPYIYEITNGWTEKILL